MTGQKTVELTLRLACSDLPTLLCYRGTPHEVKSAFLKALSNTHVGPAPPVERCRQSYERKLEAMQSAVSFSEETRKRLNGIRREKDILKKLETLLPTSHDMILSNSSPLLGPTQVCEKRYAVVDASECAKNSKFARYEIERRYERGIQEALCKARIRIELIGRADGSALSIKPRKVNYAVEIKKRHHRMAFRREEDTLAARVQAASYSYLYGDLVPTGILLVEVFDEAEGVERLRIERFEPEESQRIWKGALDRINLLAREIVRCFFPKIEASSVDSGAFDVESYREAVARVSTKE